MNNNSCIVVITTNPLNHEGGVVAFYSQLLKHFASDEFQLQHIPLGSRMEFFYSPMIKYLLYPIFYANDLGSLAWLLLRNKRIRFVQVNPSLIPIPLIRDGFAIVLSKLMRRKSIVMFHGWKSGTVDYLRRHRLASWLFRRVYGRCDVAIVLASCFKEELLEFVIPKYGVFVTTTVYNPQEIVPAVSRSKKRTRFLFLGRISELKGVNEIIEASKLLAEREIDFEVVMVGHGDRVGIVDECLVRIDEYGLGSRFRFTGRLTGRDKFQALADSDVYVLPSWTEGCPTSVLEALGAGMFVISTDVGALKDIIHEGNNGKICRLKDPVNLADIMQWACENIEELRRRRMEIQIDAKQHYEVGKVCRQFKNIYRLLEHA